VDFHALNGAKNHWIASSAYGCWGTDVDWVESS
ncbi:MAG: hypothetical protein ACI9MN_000566, partial [Saprospiraceae bacterium]